MQLKPLATALFSALLLSTAARATTLTFENLATGAVLGTQYAALGVVFSANPFTGSNTNSTPEDWATNTDMTIVASGGPDVGGLGGPALVGGNILHAFSGWLNEDGDANFAADFSTAVSSFSADFAGVAEGQDTAIYVFDGATLLAKVFNTNGTGQYTLSYSAPSITRVVIAAGSFGDWVGVDNISFAPAVPEPQTFVLLAGGLVAMGLALRRRVG